MQIVKGSKAETVVAWLPTVPEANPRSWVFSNTGDKIVVGYVQGSLQVYYHCAPLMILILLYLSTNLQSCIRISTK